MRSFVRVVLACAAVGVAACSSSSFAVGSSEQDSGATSDTSTTEDSGSDFDSSGAPDTAVVSDGATPDDTKTSDTGPADAGPVDTGPTCTPITFAATSEADAQLLQSQPNFNWGGAGVMGSRNDLGGPMFAILRFDVSGLPASAKIQSAVLDLSWAPHATDCATACGSCADIDRDGTHDVYFLRSDWTEDKVNWNTRDGSSLWGTAGAILAGVDRSTVPAATFKRAKAASASIAFGIDAFAAHVGEWRSSAGKLSFLVQAEGNALFLMASREGRAQCTSNGPAPKLTIKYCAP